MSGNELVLVLAVVEAVQLVLLALVYGITKATTRASDDDRDG